MAHSPKKKPVWSKSLRKRIEAELRKMCAPRTPDEWTMLERVFNAYLCYNIGLDDDDLAYITYCRDTMEAGDPLSPLEISLLEKLYQWVRAAIRVD